MELTTTKTAGRAGRDDAALGLLLDQHRAELTGYCRWKLGSKSEAEDAVQETFMRAWRGYGRFEGRAKLRSWLYRIATNVCIDIAQARRRVPTPVDVESPTVTSRGTRNPDSTGRSSSPAPPAHVTDLATGADPAEVATERESVRLALTALQLLPPRQRAAVILCEVLCWTAKEAAELLDCTVASVNSALQRARAAFASGRVGAAGPRGPAEERHRRLAASYVDAFDVWDMEALVSLVRTEPTDAESSASSMVTAA